MIQDPSPPRSASIVFIAVSMMLTVGLAAGHQSLPAGTYATAISTDDVPDSFPFPPEVLAGQWQVEFTLAGTVIVSRNGELAAVGHYGSSSDVVEMTDVLGAYACESGVETGSYRWTLEDGELVLTPEVDHCDGRVVVLTARPLIAMGSHASTVRGTLEEGGRFTLDLSKGPAGTSINFLPIPQGDACVGARPASKSTSPTSC